MPVLVYFVVVGFALIALLFVADATLERSSLVIVTSDRIGLPERPYPDTIQTLTSTLRARQRAIFQRRIKRNTPT